jgi:DNA-binding IclR family transcriptional regulator
MTKVPAADNTLRILDFLSIQRGPIPAQMVATALGIPRSSAYHLLTVLTDRGYVTHVPEEKRYGLGPAAYALAASYTRQQPLTRLGAPLIAKLVDQLGESAHMAVLHGTDVLYLVEERARNRPSLITDVGVRLAATKTASGRAMLARLPASQLRADFPQSRDYAEVKRLVEVVRNVGYATEDGDVTPGLASVAFAVVDHSGWPAAAIAVTYPQTDAGVEKIVGAVSAVATELSRRIHGQ